MNKTTKLLYKTIKELQPLQKFEVPKGMFVPIGKKGYIRLSLLSEKFGEYEVNLYIEKTGVWHASRFYNLDKLSVVGQSFIGVNNRTGKMNYYTVDSIEFIVNELIDKKFTLTEIKIYPCFSVESFEEKIVLNF